MLSVTMAYEFVDVQNIDLPQGPTPRSPSATSLSNGGIAVTATCGVDDVDLGLQEFSALDIFTSNFGNGGGVSSLTGSETVIDQLSNGNLVIVGMDSDSTLYTIRNAAGGAVLATTDIGDVGGLFPDVVALFGGGFWIANQDHLGTPTHTDIEIRRYNSSGTLLGSVIVVDNSNALDMHPSLAQP